MKSLHAQWDEFIPLLQARDQLFLWLCALVNSAPVNRSGKGVLCYHLTIGDSPTWFTAILLSNEFFYYGNFYIFGIYTIFLKSKYFYLRIFSNLRFI